MIELIVRKIPDREGTWVRRAANDVTRAFFVWKPDGEPPGTSKGTVFPEKEVLWIFVPTFEELQAAL